MKNTNKVQGQESQEQFNQRHLNGVSRSFAACIARLNQPLRNQVGLTYLLCRLLDCVEDAHWISKDEQDLAFKLFINSLEQGELPDVFDLEALPSGLTESERALIKDLPQLFDYYKHTPEPAKKIILSLVTNMGQGMQHFSSKKGLQLKNLTDVNRYCYFVAGVVGEALTALASYCDKNLKLDSGLVRDSQHFGLFLQKVNLLKDQNIDEVEGRHLVPSKPEVYNSLRRNAEGAWRYIQALPKGLQSYKIFCSWSFFIGMKTLPLLKGPLKPEDGPQKITRNETLSLFALIEEAIVSSPDKLNTLYGDLIGKAEFGPDIEVVTEKSTSEADWFLNHYTKIVKPLEVQEQHRQELRFGV